MTGTVTNTSVSLVSDDSSGGSSETPETPESTGSGPTLEAALGWLLVVMGFFLGARVLRDNSFLTHLTTGDLIRVERSVPTTDPYSFTAAGEPWTVQSWFASLWYSVAGKLGGGAAIRIGNGVLTASLVAIAWRLTDRAQLALLRFAVVGAMLVVGATVWSSRPLLFGLVGLGLVAAALDDRFDPRWLIPVMWVWVNTHGSFPLAGVLVGATAVGAFLDTGVLPLREIRVGMWTVIGIVLGALNPLGPKLLWFPVELLSKREALAEVSEWKPPDFDKPFEMVFLGMAIALALSIWFMAPKRVVVPALVFAVAGFMAVRNISVATFLLVPALTPVLFKGKKLGLDGSERNPLSRGIAAMAVAGAVLCALVVFSNGGLDLERYPVDETAWLDDREMIAVDGARVIHPDTVGNFMHYRFGTEARVFVDDRFDFYPQPVLDDHLELTFGGDFAAILDRWDATAVIWESESAFGDWLRTSDAWTVQMDDDEGYILATPAS